MRGSLLFLMIVTIAGCSRGEGPVQPVAFSHRLHAGEYSVPCEYCHIYARKSTVAGVPPIQVCMNCHRFVAIDRPEVRKITQAWEKKEPIQWNRVYSLPDFVYFPHKRHVRAGVHCQECHGEVEKMERVRQFSSLEMGWCLACHKERGADKDCLACHK